MKESYGEGLATHTGPKSCDVVREDGVEASIGVRAGRVFSRESSFLRGADAVRRSGRPHWVRRQREAHPDPARSETPYTLGHTMRGNREIPESPAGDGPAGRVGKSNDARRR
jgi:RNA-directed DNA polymerase